MKGKKRLTAFCLAAMLILTSMAGSLSSGTAKVQAQESTAIDGVRTTTGTQETSDGEQSGSGNNDSEQQESTGNGNSSDTTQTTDGSGQNGDGQSGGGSGTSGTGQNGSGTQDGTQDSGGTSGAGQDGTGVQDTDQTENGSDTETSGGGEEPDMSDVTVQGIQIVNADEALVVGFRGEYEAEISLLESVTLQWQMSSDGMTWTDIQGQTERWLTFDVTEEVFSNWYRLTATVDGDGTVYASESVRPVRAVCYTLPKTRAANVSGYSDLNSAVNRLVGGETDIYITADITLEGTITKSQGTTSVHIQSAPDSGKTYTISRNGNFEMFHVGGGSASLTTRNMEFTNVVLDGGGYDASIIYVRHHCTATLNDGAVLKNSKSSKGAVELGGSYLSGISKLVMNGGEICDNTSTGNGAAVYMGEDSAFTMSGGSIHHNTAEGNGGAIYIGYKADVVMSGGSIHDNTAAGNGGAIYIDAPTREESIGWYFTMEGGEIYKNTAVEGSAIYNTVPGAAEETEGIVLKTAQPILIDGEIYLAGDYATIYVQDSNALNLKDGTNLVVDLPLKDGDYSWSTQTLTNREELKYHDVIEYAGTGSLSAEELTKVSPAKDHVRTMTSTGTFGRDLWFTPITSPAANVYIDGVNGTDPEEEVGTATSNANLELNLGTEEKPVKTLEKAYLLAKQALGIPEIEEVHIVVKNVITLEDTRIELTDTTYTEKDAQGAVTDQRSVCSDSPDGYGAQGTVSFLRYMAEDVTTWNDLLGHPEKANLAPLIRLELNSVLTLRDIVFDGNGQKMAKTTCNATNSQYLVYGSMLDLRGGDADMYDGTVLQNNVIQRTHKPVDAPQYYGGGAVFIQDGTFRMHGGVMQGNHAYNSACGGAVYVNAGTTAQTETEAGYEEKSGIDAVFYADGGTISGNSGYTGNGIAAVSGGIVKLYGTEQSSVLISDNTMEADAISHQGGGVSVTNGAVLDIQNATIQGNTSIYGGGIYANASKVSIKNAIIKGNTTNDKTGKDAFGGGVFISGCTGLEGTDSPLIEGCEIRENKAVSEYKQAVLHGGGIYYDLAIEKGLVIKDCTIAQNTAIGTDLSWGGGLYLGWVTEASSEQTAFLENTVIEGNESGKGGGIFIYEENCLEMQSSTVKDNIAKEDGGGIYIIDNEDEYDQGIEDAKLIIKDGDTLSGNQAGQHGNGIFQGERSVLCMEGTYTTDDSQTIWLDKATDSVQNDVGGAFITVTNALTLAQTASLSVDFPNYVLRRVIARYDENNTDLAAPDETEAAKYSADQDKLAEKGLLVSYEERQILLLKDNDYRPLSFQKLKETDYGTVPLEGTEFWLFGCSSDEEGHVHEDTAALPDGSADCWTLNKKSVSGEDGSVDFGMLYKGEYRLVEITTDYHYVNPLNQWKVTIDPDAADGSAEIRIEAVGADGDSQYEFEHTGDNPLVGWTLTNTEKETTPVSFYKVDAESEEGIKGVRFELYYCPYDWMAEHAHEDLATEECLQSGSCWQKVPDKDVYVSGEDGLVSLGELPDGTYMLKETEAKTGYYLPEGQWRITVESSASEPVRVTAVGSVAEGIEKPQDMVKEGERYLLKNQARKDGMGLSFTKIDAETKEPLNGASFSLWKLSCTNPDHKSETNPDGEDHDNAYQEWIGNSNDCWTLQEFQIDGKSKSSFTSGESDAPGTVTGTVDLGFIQNGTYRLVEDYMPAGYGYLDYTGVYQWEVVIDGSASAPEDKIQIRLVDNSDYASAMWVTYNLPDFNLSLNDTNTGCDTAQTTVTNTRLEGTEFQFHKTDEEGGPLQGVVFGLYVCPNDTLAQHDGHAKFVTEESVASGKCWHQIGTAVSDENGLVDFGELQPAELPGSGSYRLVELETVYGYDLPDMQWDLEVTSTGITITTVPLDENEPPETVLYNASYTIVNNETEGAESSFYKMDADEIEYIESELEGTISYHTRPLEGVSFRFYECKNTTPGHVHEELASEQSAQNGCWTPVKDRGEEKLFVSETDGKVSLGKVPIGEYRIEEVETLSGYKLPEGVQWKLTIQQGSSGASYMYEYKKVGSGDGPDMLIEPEGPDAIIRDVLPNEKVSEKEFSFTKVKAEDTDSPLPGVEFALYQCTSTEEGHTHAELASDSTADEGCWAPVLENGVAKRYISGEDGRVSLGALKPGDYMLVETKTAEGYRLPTGQWMLTVPEDLSEVTITAKKTDGGELPPAFMVEQEEQDAGTTTKVYKLPNRRETILPILGGKGILYWTLTGGALIALATVLYLSFSRKRNHINAKIIIRREKGEEK